MMAPPEEVGAGAPHQKRPKTPSSSPSRQPSDRPRGYRRPKSWRDIVPVHEAAELFPMMSDEELDALGADIKEHGLHGPLVFFQRVASNGSQDGDDTDWYLLDGRNRLAAMERAGIRFTYHADPTPFFALGTDAPFEPLHVLVHEHVRDQRG
jgi:hypothetical protein